MTMSRRGILKTALAALAVGVSARTRADIEVTVRDEPYGLEIAKLKAQGLKAAHPQEKVSVTIPKGEYRLTEPLAFGPRDSGTLEAPMTWRAEPGAVLKGGVALGPWADEGDGVVSAAIPKDGGGAFLALDMLFVNGVRASRATVPKRMGKFAIPGTRADSWSEVAATNSEGLVVSAKEFTRVRADAAEVLDAVAPEELSDVVLQVLLDWSQARRRVVGWDSAQRLVVTEACGGRPRHGQYRWCGRSGIRFENVRSAFTEPGEWLYDRRAGKVLYRLRPGETAATLKADAPSGRLTRLVTLSGVRDFVLEGLAVEVADATPARGDDPKRFAQAWQCQSAAGSDAAVELDHCERVTIRNCRVAHTGNYAFSISDGCRQVSLERCTAEDLGAGGVRIGSRVPAAPEGGISRRIIREQAPDSVAFVRVADCVFRAGGRFEPSGTAVFMTHVSDSSVEHCRIDDFYYTGIAVGYVWGYRGSVSQRNLVFRNRISRIGQGELFDLAGIYCLATSYGTRICGNWISDVGGNGIYMDEGAEGILVEDNLCERVADSGAFMHFGADCTYRNNIFFLAGVGGKGQGIAFASRSECAGVPSTFNLVGNVFYTVKGPMVGPRALGVGGIFAHNVWWNPNGVASDAFDGLSADAFFARKRAYGDVVADPLFVDAENGDFRLRPESPARRLGFREWDFAAAGPRPGK